MTLTVAGGGSVDGSAVDGWRKGAPPVAVLDRPRPKPGRVEDEATDVIYGQPSWKCGRPAGRTNPTPAMDELDDSEQERTT